MEEECDKDVTDDEMDDYLYELKRNATESAKSTKKVNTKTLTVVNKLTANIKILAEAIASQQCTIKIQ